MGAPEHQTSRAGLLHTSKPSGQPQQPASPRPSCPPACSAPHRVLQRGAWAAGQHAGKGHEIVQLSVAGLLRSRNGGGRCSGLTRALRALLCGASPCHSDRLGMNPSGHLHRRNGCGEAPRGWGSLGHGLSVTGDTWGQGHPATWTPQERVPGAQAPSGRGTPGHGHSWRHGHPWGTGSPQQELPGGRGTPRIGHPAERAP